MKLKVSTIFLALAQQATLLLVALIFCDLGLWFFHPLSDNTPGGSVPIHQTQDGVKSEIVYSWIEERLRAVSARKLSDPLGTRVLCLGASTTDQASQETQDTWCGLLETRLRKEFLSKNGDFHTLSFGVGGIKSTETAQWLYEKFDKIRPDIVITLLGINDLSWNGGIGYRIKYIEDELRHVSSEKQNTTGHLKDLCVRISQLCRLGRILKAKISTLISLKSGGALDWSSRNLPALRKSYQTLPFVEAPIRSLDPIIEFRHSVGWILDFLKSKGVRAIVVGQPVIWKDDAEFTPAERDALWFPVNTASGYVRPSGAWLQREMGKYNDAQLQEAEIRDFDFVQPLIPKTLEFFYDDCHYTDKGSQLLANAVAPTLQKLLEEQLPRKNQLH
jgi:lysophospholipase L1-like esterase